eukprot:1977887-Amphidinium_carterae.1
MVAAGPSMLVPVAWQTESAQCWIYERLARFCPMAHASGRARLVSPDAEEHALTELQSYDASDPLEPPKPQNNEIGQKWVKNRFPKISKIGPELV